MTGLSYLRLLQTQLNAVGVDAGGDANAELPAHRSAKSMRLKFSNRSVLHVLNVPRRARVRTPEHRRGPRCSSYVAGGQAWIQ